jgi:hypothetical protein
MLFPEGFGVSDNPPKQFACRAKCEAKFFRFFASPVLLGSQSFSGEDKNSLRFKHKFFSYLKRKKITGLKIWRVNRLEQR